MIFDKFFRNNKKIVYDNKLKDIENEFKGTLFEAFKTGDA
ncbi:hypothetical protein SAMN05216497_12611 [Clostridium cochlearium]|jgi:hypothetical protein|uniref:Uncharacterized protein n=1 Tax=Clostridium cochlearium TaxID=1494 RepID=A0ABY0QNJ4_CLOCO|nr:hypothetical protein SAMN05216497_12611 [Clostridium cochlearium]SNV74545.1 Uncharacterised protein [Clostridium cochlearium]